MGGNSIVQPSSTCFKMAGNLVQSQAPEEMSSVIYIGHLPHGFYEDQLRKYFHQFGKVLRLKVSRSKRTGGSKGYAFVEFADRDVAKIASDSTNNYLMFEKLLKSNVLPVSKVHPELFKNTDRSFSKPKAHLLAIQRHNQPRVPKSVKKARKAAKLEQAEKRRLAKRLKLVNRNKLDIEDITTPKSKSSGSMPSTVRTPKGRLHVLKEDPSDTEITFLTPPLCIKSSRLTRSKAGTYRVKNVSAADSASKTPKVAKKTKQNLKDKKALKAKKEQSKPTMKGNKLKKKAAK